MVIAYYRQINTYTPTNKAIYFLPVQYNSKPPRSSPDMSAAFIIRNLIWNAHVLPFAFIP